MRKLVKERLAKIKANRPKQVKRRGYVFTLPDGSEYVRHKAGEGAQVFRFSVKKPINPAKITRGS